MNLTNTHLFAHVLFFQTTGFLLHRPSLRGCTAERVIGVVRIRPIWLAYALHLRLALYSKAQLARKQQRHPGPVRAGFSSGLDEDTDRAAARTTAHFNNELGVVRSFQGMEWEWFFGRRLGKGLGG